MSKKEIINEWGINYWEDSLHLYQWYFTYCKTKKQALINFKDDNKNVKDHEIIEVTILRHNLKSMEA